MTRTWPNLDGKKEKTTRTSSSKGGSPRRKEKLVREKGEPLKGSCAQPSKKDPSENRPRTDTTERKTSEIRREQGCPFIAEKECPKRLVVKKNAPARGRKGMLPRKKPGAGRELGHLGDSKHPKGGTFLQKKRKKKRRENSYFDKAWKPYHPSDREKKGSTGGEAEPPFTKGSRLTNQ